MPGTSPRRAGEVGRESAFAARASGRRGPVVEVDSRVVKVIEMMGRNLDRRLPVGRMAASVNLSYSRLEHLFKAETGVTPASYLKKLRIEKARELLETTFLTNKQIIVKVGMSDESHFVRDFKKAYGLCPSQYRKRHYAAGNGDRP